MTPEQAERMTPEQALAQFRIENSKLINDAVKLLGPESREDVVAALSDIDLTYLQLRGGHHSRTKDAKKAAGKLGNALKKVQTIIKTKRDDLPDEIRMFFPGEVIAEWLAICTKLSTTPSGKLPQLKAASKRFAVREAFVLTRRYTQDAPHAKTKSSIFCKLAAILYGKPTTDLSSQCRAFLREYKKKWSTNPRFIRL